MSAVTFGAVVVIVLAAFAGGYVWGWLNGSGRAEHAPQTCRDKLRATEQAAALWRNRAVQVEAENKDLRRGKAEHEAAETATIEWLIEQIDEAIAAGTAPEPLALPAPGRIPAGTGA